MRVYQRIRTDAFKDTTVRKEMQKVDTFLRQISVQQARIPALPQGSTPISGGGGAAVDLNQFLYLPGRQAGQNSKQRVTFQAKVITATGTTTNPTQDAFGFRAIGGIDGQIDVNISIQERQPTVGGQTAVKTPVREWVFPALDQHYSDPTTYSTFVDASNYQIINNKTLLQTVFELADFQGNAFVYSNGINRRTFPAVAGAQVFNILPSTGMPQCTFPTYAAGNGAYDGIMPTIYIPALDASVIASTGGNQATKDRAHVFAIVKVAAPTATGPSTTPFEDGGFLYGGGSRKEIYQMAGRAMGTLAAPSNGSIPVWLASVSTTGDFATSSPLVTNIPSTAAMSAGQRIRMTTAAHIAQLGEDIYIKSVDSATQITLSATYGGANLPAEPFIVFGPVWSSLTTVPITPITFGDTRIVGRLLLGEDVGALAFTTGRVLDVRHNAANNTVFINIQPDLTALSGTATGTLTGFQIAMSGTPGYTAGSFTERGFFFTATITVPAGVTLTEGLGGQFQTTLGSGTGTTNKLTGLRVTSLGNSAGGGALPLQSGLDISVSNRTSVATTVAGLTFSLGATITGAVTNFRLIDGGQFASTAIFDDADVVNWSGLYLPALVNPTGTVLGLDIATAKNRVASLHLGTGTAGSHFLNIEAGTTTKAPIALTSGTNLTSPVAGAIEFTTDNFFVTITTGSARKGIVLDDGTQLTAARVPFATTNGRLTDDANFGYTGDTLFVKSLQLEAGTATTFPIRLIPGGATILTFPVAGTIEAATNLLYYTVQTGATRVQFVFNNGTQLITGRIPFCDVGSNQLTDDADLSFSGDTLTVTKIAAHQITGDVQFTGSGVGWPYGSCWGNEIAWTQAVATTNTWYLISDTDMTDGQLNNVTHDGSGKLTVTIAGRYLVNYAVTFSVDAANTHTLSGIAVNGTVQNDGTQHVHNQAVNAENTSASTAILNLAANDTVEVAVKHVAAGNQALTVEHLNITVVQVGG